VHGLRGARSGFRRNRVAGAAARADSGLKAPPRCLPRRLLLTSNHQGVAMNIVNRTDSASRIRAALAVAGLAASTLAASNALAASRCDAPQLRVDRIACAKAAEGPDALRQFVHRTRMIYSLYFWDYMSEGDLDRINARTAAQSAPAQQAGDHSAAATIAAR
jgi:hypothetical protein